MTHTITLERNSFGQLVFVAPDGTRQQVNPVRSFPIAAPTEGIGLVNAEGEEVAWITRIADLSPASREVLEADLSTREFMPVIERIRSVSSFATPSTWEVDTDRGPTSLVLKGEEDIRRLVRPALLIADSRGINFLIRDRYALDAHSKKMLDRFL
ncbi:hypothetical protein GCM10007933_30810 [Zoogloea oryzae]|uniref:DUF1854 domain-containing protein n=1 Tax=Zoogloea oryzae TaxID=310767 RepID=A0ABQ6FF07_9RHOO|nr:DUF1854 domain-containing protein [Zoogloea oryzae]GLT23614.1 hypothetical protein GCM10007933_30810 [Zoogloea oryzae]